jgi:hypothetical protein
MVLGSRQKRMGWNTGVRETWMGAMSMEWTFEEAGDGGAGPGLQMGREIAVVFR